MVSTQELEENSRVVMVCQLLRVLRRELLPLNNGWRKENVYEITEAIFYKISISEFKMVSMNGYTFIVD